MDAREGRGVRQRARDGPGGEHRAGELDPLAVVEDDDALGDLQRRGATTEPPRQVEVLVRLRAQGGLVGLPFAGEELLRQRWTVVGSVRFGADHHQAATEPRDAQLFGGPQSREPASDDDDDVAIVEDGPGHSRRRYLDPDVGSAGTRYRDRQVAGLLTLVSSFAAPCATRRGPGESGCPSPACPST